MEKQLSKYQVTAIWKKVALFFISAEDRAEGMCSNCRKGDKTTEEPLLHLINFLMSSRDYQCSYARMQQDWDRSLCPEGSARR